jgi:hypothetical protein
MINLLSIADAARAIELAVRGSGSGIFNVPGMDTLPLSKLIALAGRVELALPGPLLQPLYLLRSVMTERVFEYRRNVQRFHFTGLLDGALAARRLGYTPEIHVQWPKSAPLRAP